MDGRAQGRAAAGPLFSHRFHAAAEIGAIAYQIKDAIYALLFKAASDTMLTIAADPEHLGANIGITAVLHTWGSAMTHHPHVHMIVTGGGISPDGSRWIASRPDYLVPVEVLSSLFRGRMLGMLSKAHATGRLEFFGDYQHLEHQPSRPTWHRCGRRTGSSMPSVRSQGQSTC